MGYRFGTKISHIKERNRLNSTTTLGIAILTNYYTDSKILKRELQNAILLANCEQCLHTVLESGQSHSSYTVNKITAL